MRQSYDRLVENMREELATVRRNAESENAKARDALDLARNAAAELRGKLEAQNQTGTARRPPKQTKTDDGAVQ